MLYWYFLSRVPPSSIIGGGVVAKIAFCFPQTTNNGGQNVCLFICFLYDGDVKVDRNGASLTWSPVEPSIRSWWQTK